MGKEYQDGSAERKRGGPKDRLEWLADAMALDLTGNEVKALVTAVRRSDADGNFWMNQRTWAAECGLQRQNLNRAVQGLMGRGLVVISDKQQQNGRSNRYRLTAGVSGFPVNQIDSRGESIPGQGNPIPNPSSLSEKQF